MSRGMYPKQFLNLVDSNATLLQQTVERLDGLEGVRPPIVVCNEEHRFIAAEQLQKDGKLNAKILLEPVGRNTAPAVALAAMLSQQTHATDILLVMPADHVIANKQAFLDAVQNAMAPANDGFLVTFGIEPSGPETGYGYIQRGAKAGYDHVFDVTTFHEKPALTRAQQFLKSGDYYWNGGIFVFTAATYLAELQQHSPGVYAGCTDAMSQISYDHDFVRVDEKTFAEVESISIDYAVMEHTEKAAVVPLDARWSDVGSWSALWEVLPKDEFGNVAQGDTVIQDSKNSHIYAETKVVAALGLNNIVVVETDDAVLVADKTRVQDIKSVVDQLNKQDRTHTKHHRKVYRPWGWYDSIDVGPNFQVKRIRVNPGAKLSVQKHHHRAEHWVVVEGVAQVRNGDENFTLSANESTYIPIGAIHSLHNPDTQGYLEIIEVQTGSYLGEDDIVRFEDDYGRV